MTDPRYTRIDETRQPAIQQKQSAEIAALWRSQSPGGGTSGAPGAGGAGPPGPAGQAAPGVYEPNQFFEATLQNAPVAIAAQLEVSILDNAGGVVFGPSNVGVASVPITEDADGHYAIPLQAPNTPGQYSIFWDDTASSDPGESGSEDILVDVGGGTRAIPTATIISSAAAVAPGGFLLCDGGAHLRTLYPVLFEALGGESSPFGWDATNFNVPDLVGRMIAGEDNGTANRLIDTQDAFAESGGSAWLQSHTHGQPGLGGQIVLPNQASLAVGQANTIYANAPYMAAQYFNHVTLDSAGVGNGENMPPFLVLRYYIAYL